VQRPVVTPEDIQNVAFSKPVIGQRGYDEDEVDSLLGRVEAKLRDPTARGGVTAAEIHSVGFSKPPIGKRGYNKDEVDAFLERVKIELTRRAGQQSVAPVQDGPPGLGGQSGDISQPTVPGEPGVGRHAGSRRQRGVGMQILGFIDDLIFSPGRYLADWILPVSGRSFLWGAPLPAALATSGGALPYWSGR
jgi:DivIVA domain-containing protein